MTRSHLTPRRLHLAILAALAIAALLALPRALEAHTKLTSSSPAAGARLHEPPSELRLTFSAPTLVAFSRIRMIDARGVPRAVGPTTSDASDSATLRATLGERLPAGSYVLEWQTAGRDGHPLRGRFAFEVLAHEGASSGAVTGAAGAAGAAAAAVAHADAPAEIHAVVHGRADAGGEPSVEYRAARWAEFVALLALIGAVVFRLAVLPQVPGGEAMRHDGSDAARQIGIGALILLLVSAIARLVSELKSLTGGIEQDIDARALMETPWGSGWAIGLCAIPVAALALLIARRWRIGWGLAALALVPLAAAPGLTGHAGATSEGHVLAVVADTLHVLGGGAWLGTLLLVVLAGIPTVLRAKRLGEHLNGESTPSIAALVRAFHPVALASSALVVVSGLLSGWMRLGGTAALFGSDYGRTLLWKVAFVGVVVALGAFHWRDVRAARSAPAADPGNSGGGEVAADALAAGRFRRTAVMELLAGAVVLAITAALVVTSPP